MKYLELAAIILAGLLQLIQWLQAKGLLKSSLRCSSRSCRKQMSLVTRADSQDGYRWRCRCGKRTSVRDNSFFSKSNMSLSEILQLIYCWATGVDLSSAAVVTGISETTVVQWYHFLREECSAKLLRMPMEERQLGGDGLIVEINESLLARRKYNRGAHRSQHDKWIFGMYERQRKIGVIVIVESRDAATLLPIIQQFIRPGSIIYSDCWEAYNDLAASGFQHFTVDHSENFVDPETGVHTNGVVAYWSRANKKLKAVYGSCLTFVPEYIDEFQWRERFGLDRSQAFDRILEHIAEHY